MAKWASVRLWRCHWHLQHSQLHDDAVPRDSVIPPGHRLEAEIAGAFNSVERCSSFVAASRTEPAGNPRAQRWLDIRAEAIAAQIADSDFTPPVHRRPRAAPAASGRRPHQRASRLRKQGEDRPAAAPLDHPAQPPGPRRRAHQQGAVAPRGQRGSPPPSLSGRGATRPSPVAAMGRVAAAVRITSRCWHNDRSFRGTRSRQLNWARTYASILSVLQAKGASPWLAEHPHLHLPTQQLQLAMDEAGAGHRLDHRPDRLVVPGHPAHEGAEAIKVGQPPLPPRPWCLRRRQPGRRGAFCSDPVQRATLGKGLLWTSDVTTRRLPLGGPLRPLLGIQTARLKTAGSHPKALPRRSQDRMDRQLHDHPIAAGRARKVTPSFPSPCVGRRQRRLRKKARTSSTNRSGASRAAT